MAGRGAAPRAAGNPRLTPGGLRADLSAIARIGTPLILTNLCSIGVAVADTLMAATLGPTQLAAVAVGAGIWIALYLLGLGTIMALGPTVAQHYGAGRLLSIGHDTMQGIWLALLISGPIVLLMRHVTPLLERIGIEPVVVVLAQGYLDALSFGVVGAYCYHALKQMSEGTGRTVPMMVIMTMVLPINVALNFTFMFGYLGSAPLGAVGCGLGNGIAFWMMFILLALHTRSSAHYRPFGLATASSRPNAPALGRLLMLGVPIGASLFVQSGLFTTVALLMGTLGTVAVAAHQVVLNYSGLVFMVPLGFAMALTVCVGQAAGRGDSAGARRIGYHGMMLCGALSLGFGILTWFGGGVIARAYSGDAAVVALATGLFRIAAFLQVGDGLQAAVAFALRGLKDTRVPLLINALNYWGIGFGLAWLLGRVAGLGAYGIWIGLSTALCTAGVFLLLRFRWLTGRPGASADVRSPSR